MVKLFCRSCHQKCSVNKLFLILFGMGGWAKMLPLIFFFKYLKNEKRYDFALLWLLVITYFESFCQISRENFDWLTSYCDFVRGVPKNSKKKFFFFLKQLFLQNISSIHYVEVVNMIFFHLKSHFNDIWK